MKSNRINGSFCSAMDFVALVWFLPALALLPGCGKSIAVPRLEREEVAQVRAAGNYPEHAYRVEPGDTLSTRFNFHPEMNQQELVVRPDGKISAALLGELFVAGSTTSEVEGVIKQMTSGRLRNPEVEVTVARFARKYVFVTGEVGRPGPVPYRSALTPLQAIIEAGGLRNTAFADGVILVRAASSNKQFVSRKLSVQGTVTEGVPEPLFLAPHDILYVPRTAIANADLWVDQHITQLLPFIRGAAASFPLLP